MYTEKTQEDIFPSSFGPEYVGFDHITWYVGNSKQAASYYVSRMGFEQIAYCGPETGSRTITSRVVSNGQAVFVLSSPACGLSEIGVDISRKEKAVLTEMHDHLTKHGDGVKDVAFRITGKVDDVWRRAVDCGARPIVCPVTLRDGKNGSVKLATIGAYGDTVHSLVNRQLYTGPFLPGYEAVSEEDPINSLLPKIDFYEIDHCVGNQPWNGIDPVVRYYEECLDFHRYWTVDDSNMCGDYSAMRSIVVSSPNEVIKMPLNEPAPGKGRSQIGEFVDFYNGAGVQHIAFRTHNIVTAITNLRARGVPFLRVPHEYYVDLRRRLSQVELKLDEDLDLLEKLSILVDFDEKGYLLQIFTKHVSDRPTVFIEVIQRNCFDGFGAGNFKSLFQAFEREQASRGNL
ncbi:putative 4-hydroxyphenylpyruvate dioxygenase [Aspergillus campestris IBT 28561]|uniref:4-hydroxyphenylpyruvate dioxygenase n=1 Tax=Aspergillus campestris (strain IBT 28561) TaxID=1392248 RepID=A0A2I1CYE1_ASPC2|nr:putative 4-hydroxyphenylpyruvate dioxygenase [Aspergillus campestris IBT 28561]PKY02645.1 putative 4-hydroxyphenylpyruvate dioxygenase [Aspergillus campestris IBT 28561]